MEMMTIRDTAILFPITCDLRPLPPWLGHRPIHCRQTPPANAMAIALHQFVFMMSPQNRDSVQALPLHHMLLHGVRRRHRHQIRLIPLNTFTITIYGKEDRNGKRIKMNRYSTNPLIRWSHMECNGAVVRNEYRTSRPEQFVFWW